jgi:hypothetical protein
LASAFIFAAIFFVPVRGGQWKKILKLRSTPEADAARRPLPLPT